MLYELAHFIKDKCPFIWDLAELGNSAAFSIKYRKELRCINGVVNVGVFEPYKMRLAKKDDVGELFLFFQKQPKETFRFFLPHGFSKRSIRKVVGRKSFLAFILLKKNNTNEEIVGYAFMRSFVSGASYRGYMVDAEHRGQGLAKIIGSGLNRVGDALRLDMYKSISPQNLASMKVTQAVCDTEILKTLENGDFLIKCTSKHTMEINNNLTGGGD